MAASQPDNSSTMRMANSDVGLIPESPSSVVKMPRLPEEVLAEIFIETCDASYGRRCDVRWMRIVAHVCRFWRQVALRHVHLWTSINIEPRRHEHAMQFIRLSKSLPLRLYVDTGYLKIRNDEDWITFHQKSLMLLDCYLTRLSTIEFRFGRSYNQFLREFSKALLEPAPLLERLEFYHSNELVDDHDFFKVPWPNDPFIESAPRLTDVTMGGGLVTNWGSIFFDLLRLRIHSPNEMHISKRLTLTSRSTLTCRYSAKSRWRISLSGLRPKFFTP
ncbi:hypothetical protein BD410DRAFT_638832 [Rickenella mellea]|uniref:F-box domain-containing protein n=1 Tax=Rickenella mellea TaxID=50990 RepID=A0A4Y7QEW9_9AGAM|nr:hypothetical protein BD410DRAFT_638832 [Rickenella mellea]